MSNSQPNLYFIRHGESRANAERILAGSQNSPLSSKGIQQAQAEASMIKQRHTGITTIISSGMSRAYDTAVIIAEAINYRAEDIVVIDELHEKSGGSFEGQPLSLLYGASDATIIDAGGECLADFADRVRRANQLILAAAHGQTLIVGHSGFYRMAQVVANDWSLDQMMEIPGPANGKLLEYPL